MSAREIKKLIRNKSNNYTQSTPKEVCNADIVLINATLVAATKLNGVVSTTASGSMNITNRQNSPLIPGAPDPVVLLNLLPHFVRDTTELHMGRKGMRSIHPNFQNFINLYILWLNDNQLTEVKGLIPPYSSRRVALMESRQKLRESQNASPKDNEATTLITTANSLSTTMLLLYKQNKINGNKIMNELQQYISSAEKRGSGCNDKQLENISSDEAEDLNAALAEPTRGCYRLKQLCLSNNRITTLAGDIPRLRYLEILFLANNLLADMVTVAQQLAPLRALRQLDLYGNPMCEEKGYRLYMINNNSTLEIFDNEIVTVAERREATALHSNNKRDQYEKLLFLESSNVKHQNRQQQTLNELTLTGIATTATVADQTQKNTVELTQSSSSRSPMTVQERCQCKSIVGFGTTVPPAIPMRRAEDISQSVAILNSRATLIKAEKMANKRREREKNICELTELREQRRLLHELWNHGAKIGPDETDQASNTAALVRRHSSSIRKQQLEASVKATNSSGKLKQEHQKLIKSILSNPDKNLSRLFSVNSTKVFDPKIAHLIELYRRKEEASNINDCEKEESIKKEINAAIHCLVPDRTGDFFGEELARDKNQTINDNYRRYNCTIVSEVAFLPSELAVIRKQFAECGSIFSLDMLPSLLRAIGSDSNNNTNNNGTSRYQHMLKDISEAFKKAFPPTMVLPSIAQDSLAQSSAATASIPSSSYDPPVSSAKKREDKIASKPPVSSKKTNNKNVVVTLSTEMPKRQETPPTVGVAINTEQYKLFQRKQGITEASLMAPVAIDEALAALTRYTPFILARIEEFEQTAHAHLHRLEYNSLKADQQRINDLKTHMTALNRISTNSTSPSFVDISSIAAELLTSINLVKMSRTCVIGGVNCSSSAGGNNAIDGDLSSQFQKVDSARGGNKPSKAASVGKSRITGSLLCGVPNVANGKDNSKTSSSSKHPAFMTDYFSLLNVPRAASINLMDLRQNYYNFQAEHHPDVIHHHHHHSSISHSTTSSSNNNSSSMMNHPRTHTLLDASSYASTAYDVLKHPYKRCRYLMLLLDAEDSSLARGKTPLTPEQLYHLSISNDISERQNNDHNGPPHNNGVEQDVNSNGSDGTNDNNTNNSESLVDDADDSHHTNRLVSHNSSELLMEMMELNETLAEISEIEEGSDERHSALEVFRKDIEQRDDACWKQCAECFERLSMIIDKFINSSGDAAACRLGDTNYKMARDAFRESVLKWTYINNLKCQAKELE